MTKFKYCSYDERLAHTPRVYRVDNHPIYSVYGIIIRRGKDKNTAYIIWDDEPIHDEYIGVGNPPNYYTAFEAELCELGE
jgi:hypothetical protein